MEKDSLKKELKCVIIEDMTSDIIGVFLISLLGVIAPIGAILTQATGTREIFLFAGLITMAILWLVRTVKRLKNAIRSLVMISRELE